MIRNQTYFHSLTHINSYNKEATTLKDLKKKLIAPVVAGSGGDGYCNVYISSDSSWTVTGDSTITNLYNAGTIKDADGNTVTIKGTDGTVYVNGTSAYTITVGSYSTSVDLSGASGTDNWSSYAVEKPS